jgi:hypothetical protein
MEKSLEEVFLEYGVSIRNERGFLRNVIDVLYDIYFNIDKDDFELIKEEIYCLHKLHDLFEEERKKGDWTL